MKFKVIVSIVLLSSIIQAQTIDSARVKAHLSFLASDEMNGRAAGSIENTLAAKYMASTLESQGLVPCKNNQYYWPFEFNQKTIYNVCAAKEGSSGKIIIVSAHFDHIDPSKSVENDSIYNGADDNATGVTTVLSIAEYLKEKKSNHTIWFIGFNAEEAGLIGSKAMVKELEQNKELNNIAAVVNFEMLGTRSKYGANTVFMTGSSYSNLDETLNEMSPKGFQIIQDPYAKYNLFYHSDNAPFAQKGVVAHSLAATDIDNSAHYHQPQDELDIIDIENLTQLINSLGEMIYIMSNSELDLRLNIK